MSEKLSAAKLADQQYALDQIKAALQKGTAKQGTIAREITIKRRIHFLEGDFQGLGQVVLADSCKHPKMRGKSYRHNEVCGLGAYPWSPIGDMQHFIDAF